LHQLVLPHDAVDEGHLQVVGPGGDKDVAVEGPQLVLAPAAGGNRNVVDGSVVNHRGQRGRDVLGNEFAGEMVGPNLFQFLGVHGCGERKRWCHGRVWRATSNLVNAQPTGQTRATSMLASTTQAVASAADRLPPVSR